MPTIAACQLAVEDLDVETNLDRVRDRVAGLEDGVELALFPEQMLTGFVADERIYDAAIDREGHELDALRTLAATHDTHLLVGFVEADGDHHYNAAAYVRPGGETTVYRKRHLWAGEQAVLDAGEELVTVETPAGEAGIVTCYDLNFVGDSAAFTDRRVDALLVVGAWPAAYSENWTLLVRARALDGVRWAVGAGRTGRRELADAPVVEYAGRSLVARPDGGLGQQLDRGEGVLRVDLDDATLARQRNLVGVYDG
jgi:(R)-amidase